MRERTVSTVGRSQRGALMLVTLLILLIVSILGMSAMDGTGMEMQMSNNSRTYQQAFEAAEYTLSWVENDLQQSGFFSSASLDNSGCGAVCFDSSCSGGFCFDGSNPNDAASCTLNAPAAEPYESATIWTDATLHRTLNVPDSSITARYIIEYRCYTPRDPLVPFDPTNSARMYRVTAYVVGEGGRARVMLRSTVKEV